MLKKTMLAIAITSSLSAVGFASEKYQKYNFSNQENLNLKNITLEQNKHIQKPTTWLIKLNAPSLSESSINGALSKPLYTQVTININKAQHSVIAAVRAISKDIDVVGQTKNLVSGVIVKGNGKLLKQLLKNHLVKDVLPVYDYELNVEESAVYMKGKALVEAGVASGKGIRVAVLDTGVDYTHAAMGGAGTVEAYEAAIENIADTPNWPQGKVIGGYDFINDDPDPIDYGSSHGTHVSHSVFGLAPDAELYAYTVCAYFCPGLAQLNALEAAMDPNGDGDISDRVDVINMSLGGAFGTTRGGAVQEVIDQAARLGVITVIAAGNDGATPFIVGGPSTTKSAISVGAMTHPTTESVFLNSSFNGIEITAEAAGFNKTLTFSFTNDDASLVYPEVNQKGCDTFTDDTDFTGKVVLIDRGECNFTTKVINAQNKGAVFVIIANHTAGAGAPGLGGSDDAVVIPSVGISKEDGLIIKEALTGEATITFSFVAEESIATGAIANFTSRGPSLDGWLKPEITAPGVDILTAKPGTGDSLSPMSGTSFSSPMTAGAVALIREALPNRSAFEVKATLMNAANLDVTLEPRSINPDAELAPISFIGSGLVDVEKATNLPVAAWDKNTKQAALAFGLMNLSSTEVVTKTVTIKNFSSNAKTYALSLVERFADDAESEAISFEYPSSVTIPAGGSIDIDVTLTIKPRNLPEWTLTSEKLGSADGSGDLTTIEYDGALVFTDGDENFHLVYHLLPKASASFDVAAVISDEGVKRVVTNNGVVDLEAFTVPLSAEDEVGDSSYLDLEAASIEVLNVPEKQCESGYSIFTTFTMAEGFLSTLIGGFYADFDMNSDGNFDYSAQALPLKAFGDTYPEGIIVTFTTAWNSLNGGVGNLYFTSGNNFVTLQSCVENIGLSATDLGNVNATVRFRIADSQRDFYNWNNATIDSATVKGINFSVSNELTALVDDNQEEIDSLAVGETANLLMTGEDFVILSNSGSVLLAGKPEQEEGIAPLITPEQVFSVDENTDNDTIIGNVISTDPDLFTSPVSEYFIESSSSVAVMMKRDGTIKVADSTLLDYDAGLTEIALDVIAIDTVGNISETEVVTIYINNLLDEAYEQPNPPAPKKSNSGGPFGWISFLLLSTLWLRLQKK